MLPSNPQPAPTLPNPGAPCRHGTVVATPSVHSSHSSKAGTVPAGTDGLKRWLPANRWQLSLRTRKLLLWAHLLVINGLCIGELWRMAQGVAACGAER